MSQDERDGREMLETLVRGFVDEPDAVEVSESRRAQAIVYEIKVAPRDLGKVIGRQGRTARALRSLLAAVAQKTDQRLVLQILD